MLELPSENEEGLAPITATIAVVVLLIITGIMTVRFLSPYFEVKAASNSDLPTTSRSQHSR